MSRFTIKKIQITKPILSAILIAAWSNIAWGGSYITGANYEDSKWDVKANIFECSLEHEITGYGKLKFRKRAGEQEEALLNIWSMRSIPGVPATIDFLSPPWNNDDVVSKGWTFYFGEQRKPMEFSARNARKILDSLKIGLMPVITHTHNSDRRQDVKARISPVNFVNGYEQYMSCIGGLLPYSFNELRKSDIYFETGSSRIDEDMGEILSHIIEYSKDPDVHRIELSGYTDSVGSFRANHQLASYRVDAVRDYLIKNGVSERIIRIKIKGEQGAIARNNTEHGRAKNRRVEVKMFR